MNEYLAKLKGFVEATQIVEQINSVDPKGLFTNPYFMVPFVIMIGYMIYKQEINNLIVIAVLIGWWIFSGTPYMQDLSNEDGIQLGKVLPVAGAGVATMALFVYVFFIRSD